jgi:hypothetical protein
MADVVQIGSAQGSYLMTVAYYRLPNGEINAVIEDMPASVIESEATISARFTRAAIWTLDGMLSLMRQGVRFDEETRASQNDNAAVAESETPKGDSHD